MKKKSTQFDKFTKKKSNAAIKEGFKQEKRKWKKDREEYFDKQKQAASLKSRQAAEGIQQPVIIKREQSTGTMPLNKYIAHCGFCSRQGGHFGRGIIDSAGRKDNCRPFEGVWAGP